MHKKGRSNLLWWSLGQVTSLYTWVVKCIWLGQFSPSNLFCIFLWVKGNKHTSISKVCLVCVTIPCPTFSLPLALSELPVCQYITKNTGYSHQFYIFKSISSPPFDWNPKYQKTLSLRAKKGIIRNLTCVNSSFLTFWTFMDSFSELVETKVCEM